MLLIAYVWFSGSVCHVEGFYFLTPSSCTLLANNNTYQAFNHKGARHNLQQRKRFSFISMRNVYGFSHRARVQFGSEPQLCSTPLILWRIRICHSFWPCLIQQKKGSDTGALEGKQYHWVLLYLYAHRRDRNREIKGGKIIIL